MRRLIYVYESDSKIMRIIPCLLVLILLSTHVSAYAFENVYGDIKGNVSYPVELRVVSKNATYDEYNPIFINTSSFGKEHRFIIQGNLTKKDYLEFYIGASKVAAIYDNNSYDRLQFKPNSSITLTLDYTNRSKPSTTFHAARYAYEYYTRIDDNQTVVVTHDIRNLTRKSNITVAAIPTPHETVIITQEPPKSLNQKQQLLIIAAIVFSILLCIFYLIHKQTSD